MSLSLITPTRRRWHWLRAQARAIAGQLAPDDRWIIAVDNDRPDKKVVGEIARLIPAEQIIWLHCIYARPTPPFACVNRLRNAATALVPAGHDIVEVDDHDLLAPYALAEIRAALAAGYDYIFGWYHQQAVVDVPCTVGNQLGAGDGMTNDRMTNDVRHSSFDIRHCVPWPNVEHRYQRGSFERREIDGIGVRAFKRWLWEMFGGWNTNIWPGGDYHFALRAERAGAHLICLEQFLCTVTIEPDSLMAHHRVGWEKRACERRPTGIPDA
jgi:hypothetical protein